MEKNIANGVLILLIGMLETISSGVSAATDNKSQTYELTVLEDRGGQSVESYMPKRLKKDFSLPTMSRYPVKTSSMTVGRVTESEAKDIPYQVASRPLFIIGYDPVSIDWLKKNTRLLIEKKAVGMVVNVNSKKQMQKLRQVAGGKVLMQPVQGDDIAKNLGIKHYPFYMSNEGVMR